MPQPLPPGPRLTPLQTLRFLKDPTRFTQESRARFGDPFTAPLPVGDVVMTGSPEGLRDIFSADPSVFEPLGNLPLEPAVGQHSLLLLSGQRHKRERKLLMPPFHGERMRAYGQTLRESTLSAVRALSPGAPLRAQELTQDISLTSSSTPSSASTSRSACATSARC